ncbi:hypothetical protein QQ020_17215 [Fulvivirgaceae bacterium BMA12]|uniref:Uncharacterized protein n=1 Tax=Agaribacillus aureus TaxID=3051825 RepID=A0ABT8L7T0_9BACT|nr:hypothetical protein [Fulvivirgaceae bacterium BMA12]
MKKLFVALLLTFGIFGARAQDLLTQDIRAAFFEATLDLDKATALFDKINMISNPSPIMLAYRGVLEAILVKTKWSPFAKFALLNKSRESFTKAVSENSNDLEIRFLRFAVEHNTPDVLGYSQNLAADKDFIMENLDYFERDEGISDQMTNYIINFMMESKYYTPEEIDRIRTKMNPRMGGI